MINVLIPSMGKSLFYKESYFPKMMIDVAGKTMLEQVVNNYSGISDRRFIFVFDYKDCCEFHLDDSVRILTGAMADILILQNETAGALCTCLMAVEKINNDIPLIISNCDQLIDVNIQEVWSNFKEKDYDAGVITFDNVHPRWSYARTKEDTVIEVAEKHPLSKHAIAGFYYYKHGKNFIEAAKRVILKDCQHNGKFYISSSLNEIILMGGKVGFFDIPRERYHSFFSPEKIQEFERTLRGEGK